MMRRLVLAATAGLLLPLAASANDSASELAAGGLVLVRTEGIAMQREDLLLSPGEVRVRYEMRNNLDHPVTLRVAFPMPEVPKDTPGGMETSTGAGNIDVEPPSEPNFMKFRVTAGGKDIKPGVEVRALLADGRDIADALRQIGGWKLVMRPRYFVLEDNKKWDLDAATRKRLEELGALKSTEDGYDTQWTTQITFHWQQTFKRGVTIIEHSYAPILGYHQMAPNEKGGWRGTDEAKQYCIDEGTDRALQALHREVMEKRRADKSGDPTDRYLGVFNLAYILHTASNWDGPIGTFHFMLQTGSVAQRLGNGIEIGIMTLCTDLPLKRTGPGRFEATVTSYEPKSDLRVLMFPR